MALDKTLDWYGPASRPTDKMSRTVLYGSNTDFNSIELNIYLVATSY